MGLLVNPSRFAAGGGVYDTAFPPMTADNAPAGYVASASSVSAGGLAFYAFDQSALEWKSAGEPSWLAVQFPSQRKASHYALTSSTSTSGRHPKDFTLSGSNDGLLWTLLDTQTAVPAWASAETRTYPIASPGAYLHYRLDLIATQGSSSGRVAELAFTFLSN